MSHSPDSKAPSGSWFTEGELPFSKRDISISIRTSKTLVDEKSKYGHIQIFDTPFFGRILVLDGIIQIADRTEFIYHEMMVILPSIYHQSPKKILIIGGGDGGAVKQALRIKTLERVVMVEIDKDVVDVCKKFMPNISEGALDDEKVELIIADGIEYVKNSNDKYDVISLDVSDPVPGGPAEDLISKAFYENVKSLLNPGGVLLTHCGSLIFQSKKSKIITNSLKKLFKNVTLHQALIPEFELTEFGFLVCSDSVGPDVSQVKETYKRLLESKCQYLSPEIFISSKSISPYIKALVDIDQ